MKKIFIPILFIMFNLSNSFADTLINGAPFLGEVDLDLPRSIVILTFQGAPTKLLPEHQGVILLLEEAFKSGATNTTQEVYKEKLFKQGADIDYSHGTNFFQVTIKTPPSEMENTLSLVKDTLTSPRLSKHEFKDYFENVLAGLKGNFESMQHVIFYLASRDSLSYSPYSLTGDTSPSSFLKIDYDLFIAEKNKVIDFDSMIISYIGSEKPSLVKKLFEKIFSEKLASKFIAQKENPSCIQKKSEQDYLVIDKPGATDNQIAFIYPKNLKRDGKDWPIGRVTMDLLGGGLHGRLGTTLRTERGLTYAAMSWLSTSNLPLWMAWTFGGVEQTKGLLNGVPEVIAKYKNENIKNSEIIESQERQMNKFMQLNELSKDRLSEKIWSLINHINPSFNEKYPHLLKEVTAKKVEKFKKNLNTDKPFIYLMGDKEKILKILNELGISLSRIKVISIEDIQ